MNYYTDIVTQKSWEELKRLRKITDFILIGGWAVYLYTKTLKSKDIDIIVDFDKLPILGKHYIFGKNDRLKKYEARKEEVQIDIYLPHYSQIGIPVEILIKQTKNLEGFTVVDSDYLLTLKIYTLLQRGRTPKGRKDFVDIIALINARVFEWEKLKTIFKTYALQKALDNFFEFLNEYYEVPELNLNNHQFAKLKKEFKVRKLQIKEFHS